MLVIGYKSEDMKASIKPELQKKNLKKSLGGERKKKLDFVIKMAYDKKDADSRKLYRILLHFDIKLI